MKKHIDLFIINNCPAFYKINLYNEIAKYLNIHVVFIGLSSHVVINDSYKQDIKFSHSFLNECNLGDRCTFKSILNLLAIVRKFTFKKIVFGGYVDIEQLLLMFLVPRAKNCLQFESSIYETKVTGFKGIVKKIILSRFTTALPSGELHAKVFQHFKFKGNVQLTKGVGIFPLNKTVNRLNVNTKKKFLFVGRLVEVKNIRFLVEIFNELDAELTVVGTGHLEKELKQLAKPNIHFLGFVSNNDIGRVYSTHDVFILPSLREPWGLVVEEAIYYGLPVIVSDTVGSQVELVKNPATGVVYHNTKDGFLEAMNTLLADYDSYKQNCLNFDFNQRNREQVEAYTNLLDD